MSRAELVAALRNQVENNEGIINHLTGLQNHNGRIASLAKLLVPTVAMGGAAVAHFTRPFFSGEPGPVEADEPAPVEVVPVAAEEPAPIEVMNQPDEQSLPRVIESPVSNEPVTQNSWFVAPTREADSSSSDSSSDEEEPISKRLKGAVSIVVNVQPSKCKKR